MEQTNQPKPAELSPAQKFFALVARLRMVQKQFFKVHAEIGKCADSMKLADLKVKKEKMLSNSKAIEKLIDAEIDRVDEYYNKHNLTKFWL